MDIDHQLRNVQLLFQSWPRLEEVLALLRFGSPVFHSSSTTHPTMNSRAIDDGNCCFVNPSPLLASPPKKTRRRSLHDQQHSPRGVDCTKPLDDECYSDPTTTSGCSLASPVYIAPYTPFTAKTMKKVRFAPVVSQRIHAPTVGHHPYCTTGLSLSLDWSYSERRVPLSDTSVRITKYTLPSRLTYTQRKQRLYQVLGNVAATACIQRDEIQTALQFLTQSWQSQSPLLPTPEYPDLEADNKVMQWKRVLKTSGV